MEMLTPAVMFLYYCCEYDHKPFFDLTFFPFGLLIAKTDYEKQVLMCRFLIVVLFICFSEFYGETAVVYGAE